MTGQENKTNVQGVSNKLMQMTEWFLSLAIQQTVRWEDAPHIKTHYI